MCLDVSDFRSFVFRPFSFSRWFFFLASVVIRSVGLFLFFVSIHFSWSRPARWAAPKAAGRGRWQPTKCRPSKHTHTHTGGVGQGRAGQGRAGQGKN